MMQKRKEQKLLYQGDLLEEEKDDDDSDRGLGAGAGDDGA